MMSTSRTSITHKAPFTLELELATVFKSLTLGFKKLSSKAQTIKRLTSPQKCKVAMRKVRAPTIEHLTNPQPLNRLSKCKLAMLIGRYQHEMVLNKREFTTSQRILESKLA